MYKKIYYTSFVIIISKYHCTNNNIMVIVAINI